MDLSEFRGLLSHESSSLAVSRHVLPISYQLEAMSFAEIKQWRGGCLEWPVKLPVMLHALRLEWVKSMDWTASLHLLRLS